MEKIKFITDIASDLPRLVADTHDITMLSLPILLNDKELSEADKIDPLYFYSLLEQSHEIPKTSQISFYTFLDVFEEAYHAKYTHVIGLFLPSFASGTYHNALSARDEFYKQHPEATHFTIALPDTLTYSLGYGYPTLKGAKMAQAGETFESIMDFITTWLNEFEIYFTLFTLDYAKKSGRIGIVSAMVGEALGLKTIVHLKKGKMSVCKKVRGQKAVAKEMTQILKSHIQPHSDYLILKGQDKEIAHDMTQLFSETLGYEVAFSTYAGAVLTIHTGPHVLGIGIRGKKD